MFIPFTHCKSVSALAVALSLTACVAGPHGDPSSSANDHDSSVSQSASDTQSSEGISSMASSVIAISSSAAASSTALDEDADHDGIIDRLDLCADTPKGTTVDTEGCEWVVMRERVQAENYAAASDTTAGNEGVPTLCDYNGLNVDVQDTSDVDGQCNVGWIRAGEWLEYSLDLPAGQYDLQLRVASEAGGGQVKVAVDGAALGTIDVASTGGWQNWRTLTLRNVAFVNNAQTVRFTINAGGFNFNWLEWVSVIPDADHDGVIDANDQCPDTAFGKAVDQFGCASDNDDDGVLNDSDDCPDTEPMVRVDNVGCPISDATTKTIHTMTVLIDFSDAPAKIPADEVEKMLNKPGHTGDDYLINVRDYWYEVSRQKVDVVSHTFGYYRAPQTAAYYKTQTYTAGVNLVGEAFNWIKDNNPNFDWDQLALEKDGTFLGLQAVLTTRVPVVGATHYFGGARFTAPNGVQAGQLTAQTLWDWYFKYQDLFTFLHEQGHMLWSWPDLYNVEGSRGTGDFDLMSSNNYKIGVPNAALLAKAGWVDVIDISGRQTITLDENGTTVVRYQNPAVAGEYFMIEARNNSPLSAKRIPGAKRGLFIWHVDDRVNGNRGVKIAEGEHYQISLEQADGKNDLENNTNGGDEGDVFGPGDTFSDNSQPNARWWNGQASGLVISDIEYLEGGKIRFDVQGTNP